jgi:D-lactate dehydrogenase (cytochrome)
MSYDCSFLEGLDADVAVSFGDDDREQHAADWGAQARGTAVTPDAVVWPESTAEVSAVLAAADRRGVPVTPYAAGTSLEGNAVPAHRGISMDVTRMDEVLEIRPDDFQADVEPGLLGDRLDEALGDHGLFFPPMPASADISTVGGMIVNDASGMKTVKYGEVGDWVLGLEAVLADGTVVRTGSRAKKSSAGYNLTDLLVGSEGTLAVVTRATVEVERLPAHVRGGRAVFEELDDATGAIYEALANGVDVATIELMDDVAARMANDYNDTGLPDQPMVFFEFHGARESSVEAEIEACREAFAEHGVERFETAGEETMAELWRARREMAGALQAYEGAGSPLHPGDITVPISRYGDVIRYAKELAEAHDVVIPCFGHAGDGNVHYAVFVDAADEEQVALGEQLYGRIVRKAIEFGGTATGEHGVGLGKREYLELEHGEGGVETMRRVKRSLDPNDTLNPGKMFPETAEGRRVRADDD